MEERDPVEAGVCANCGEELDLGDARNFFYSPSTVVCYDCARRHGGLFDAEAEVWKVPPHLGSLKARRPRKT